MSTIESCPTCAGTDITADCTVNAVILKTPSAIQVLNGFGIDTCCGGGSTLAEAAERAQISPEVLLEALAGAH